MTVSEALYLLEPVKREDFIHRCAENLRNQAKTKQAIHFGHRNIDVLLHRGWNTQNLKKYFDGFSFHKELLKRNWWLKRRTKILSNGEKDPLSATLSLKTISSTSEKGTLKFDEFTNPSQVKQKLSEIGLELSDCLEMVHGIPFTRYFLAPNFYLDCCRFDGDDFYLVCAASATTDEELETLEQFLPDSILRPVPSKVVEQLALYHPNAFDLIGDETLKSLDESFEDYRDLFHRKQDPFDPTVTLHPLATGEQVDEWMGRLYNGKLQSEKGKFCSAKELYDTTPQALLRKISNKRKGAVLYHALHNWETPQRYEREELVRRIEEDPSIIPTLKWGEVQTVCDCHLLSTELDEKCGELYQIFLDFKRETFLFNMRMRNKQSVELGYLSTKF